MPNTFTAPGVAPSEFLLPNGQSLSVHVLESSREKMSSIMDLIN
jgi:hypothetical protein